MSSNADVNLDLPTGLTDYLSRLDAFIEAEIRPLERADDNIRFFDHRREWARTDFERGGLPRHEWEALLTEMRPARRPSRTLSLCVAQGIRRQGWLQPRDGDHPRASSGQGVGPAQRSAKR